MTNVNDLLEKLTAACEAWHRGLPANDVVRLCENDIPHLIAELLTEGAKMKQDMKRIGDVLGTVKSQGCQGHYSTMIQQIIDRNKELEYRLEMDGRDWRKLYDDLQEKNYTLREQIWLYGLENT